MGDLAVGAGHPGQASGPAGAGQGWVSQGRVRLTEQTTADRPRHRQRQTGPSGNSELRERHRPNHSPSNGNSQGSASTSVGGITDQHARLVIIFDAHPADKGEAVASEQEGSTSLAVYELVFHLRDRRQQYWVRWCGEVHYLVIARDGAKGAVRLIDGEEPRFIQ